MSIWNGYEEEELVFEDRRATIVFPRSAAKGRFWSMKMEYKEAFPETEIALLEAGFHVVYLKNDCRWVRDEDNEIRARFVDFIVEKYRLNPKFCPIGMSAGGAHSISFASVYPEKVAAMFLDAPVVDFSQCPVNMPTIMEKEFYPKYGNLTVEEIKACPENPLNRLSALTAARIPLFLVCGDADQVVLFEENGKVLAEAYDSAGIEYRLVVTEGRGHHPHGLADPTQIVDFLIGAYN